MRRAFIIRPFGKKKDRDGREMDFDRIQIDLIDPALTDAGAWTHATWQGGLVGLSEGSR